jgi:hypothetical protein
MAAQSAFGGRRKIALAPVRQNPLFNTPRASLQASPFPRRLGSAEGGPSQDHEIPLRRPHENRVAKRSASVPPASIRGVGEMPTSGCGRREARLRHGARLPIFRDYSRNLGNRELSAAQMSVHRFPQPWRFLRNYRQGTVCRRIGTLCAIHRYPQGNMKPCVRRRARVCSFPVHRSHRSLTIESGLTSRKERPRCQKQLHTGGRPNGRPP